MNVSLLEHVKLLYANNCCMLIQQYNNWTLSLFYSWMVNFSNAFKNREFLKIHKVRCLIYNDNNPVRRLQNGTPTRPILRTDLGATSSQKRDDRRWGAATRSVDHLLTICVQSATAAAAACWSMDSGHEALPTGDVTWSSAASVISRPTYTGIISANLAWSVITYWRICMYGRCM